jgi:hypothetical protein
LNSCPILLAAALFLLAVSCLAQAQQTGSLADAARQARAQKQAQPVSENNRAQQVADELSEDQNDGAPGGFKTYNAGDYKLWVPAPYRVEGHDDAGPVLSGPMVGSKVPMVLLGTPIVSHFENNDAAFQDTATQFAHVYSQSANCTKTTIANHAAYQCSMGAAKLLDRRVSGNAVFVRGAGNIYPVFCVAPTDSRSRDLINNSRANSGTKAWARESLDREDEDVRNVMQKCDTVFQSIQIRNGAQQNSTAESNKQNSAPPANAGGQASLADVARGLHDSNATASVNAAPPAFAAAQSTAPAGLKVHAFTYCKGANDCWNASILVPADAQLLSSDCKQYVFETKVQGMPFLLLAGSSDGCASRAASDPNLVRWNQLVLPETQRAPGTASTISSQQASLDGKSAVITTMRFKAGMADWIGKRAEIDANGIPLVVGCMAPKEHFYDGDTVCSSLIDSLRLP